MTKTFIYSKLFEATKWESRGSEIFCAPPPLSRLGKTFYVPLLKGGNFLWPPSSMLKTSSTRVKTTPKLIVPTLQYG